MFERRALWTTLLTLCVLSTAGCTRFGDRLAGYGCPQPPAVVDPRGVPVEPRVDCKRCRPGCGDTAYCYQCRRSRQTLVDSLYALACECDCWPYGDRCE